MVPLRMQLNRRGSSMDLCEIIYCLGNRLNKRGQHYFHDFDGNMEIEIVLYHSRKNTFIRYQNVLSACGLQPDLLLLANGDETEVVFIYISYCN